MSKNEFIWNPLLDDPAEELVFNAIPAVRDKWHKHHHDAVSTHRVGWSIPWKKDITCLLAEVLRESNEEKCTRPK